jgi:hypothetical protein
MVDGRTAWQGQVNSRGKLGTQRRGNLSAKADEVTSDAIEASGNRLITGVDRATVADLDAAGQSWRTDGSHGLLQFQPHLNC